MHVTGAVTYMNYCALTRYMVDKYMYKYGKSCKRERKEEKE